MLQSTEPTREFDALVVLGAHNDSLKLRIKHAVDILGKHRDSSGLIVLSCFRPIHPKEGVDLARIDTETDLAVELLQNELRAKFELESVSSWDDLPEDPEKQPGEYAVAFVGKLGLYNTVVISGSVPSDSVRATTISTLESLQTYLESSAGRLLFVTTSLHLPYQALQIEQVMRGVEHEVVGVGYESLKDLSLDSPDAKFRKVLQEIGATIKNALT